MKHLFVINPAAGKVDRTRELTQEIGRVMGSRGEPYEIYVTKAPMDACGAIRARAADGQELRVYACGGDGTLNECINGAAGLENVAVTHHPTGTGNDFCKIFGRDAGRFKDFGALLDAEVRALDLIDCNGRYSVNICSVGIDARIGTDVHKYSGFFPGKGAYIASMAVNLIKGVNRRFTVSLDGDRQEGEFALICACNGRYYGGGFNPVPEALPDDGLLDFLIITKVTRLRFLKLVGKFKAGRYKEISRGLITYRRCRTLQVESKEPLRINVDGELLNGNHAHFAVCPGMVRFFYPRGLSW